MGDCLIMGDKSQKIKFLADALTGLVKLVKAMSFYPPDHPALASTANDAFNSFEPLFLEENSLRIAIKKEGFFLDDSPILAGAPLLQKLAFAFFSRRVQSLLILSGFSSNDLATLCRSIAMDPAEIQNMGGFQQLLLDQGLSTIWTNEITLEEALERKEEIDAQRPTTTEDAPDTSETSFVTPSERDEPKLTESSTSEEEERRSLAAVLDDLRRETCDEDYLDLAQEAAGLIPSNLNDGEEMHVLGLMAILLRNSISKKSTDRRRSESQKLLKGLATTDILNFLIVILCTKGFEGKPKEALLRIVSFLSEKALPLLMTRLISESDSYARRCLSEALAYQGEGALPTLYEYLDDERWFVVRNSVAIIGDIRSHSSSERLHPVLLHDDTRVRREVIRALTRIGSHEALGILLETAEGDNPELCRQAILSLGAMKNPAAVPTLVKLIERPDATTRHLEVTREAIKSLGEIGAPEGAPPLIGILNKRTLWRRSQIDDLRILAAKALGEIGSLEARMALEAASDDRSEEVSIAAADALRTAKRTAE